MKKRNMIIGAVAIATVGSGVAIAGSKNCGGHFGGRGMSEHAIEHMVEKMDRRLELSNEQEVQITNILTSNMESLRDIKKTRKELGAEVMNLDPTSPQYEADVNALADQIASKVREKTLQAADVVKQVSSVLTEDQRAEAMEIIQSRMEHRKKWHDDDNA